MEYHSLPIDKWEGGTFARFQYFRLLDWFDYPNEKGKRIIDFITGFQIKYGLRRRIPDQYPCLYGGSNWMSLTRECWEHIARDDRRSKKFLNRLRFTFASDEVYFHTLVMNSPFKSDVINNNLRLIKWRGGAVKVLNQLDIWDILTSQAFFARKFDSKYSKVLLDALAHFEKISYASHFNITFAKKILLLSRVVRPSTICDITSGVGLYVKFLQDAGFHAYGMDSDSRVCELSRLVFCGKYSCQNIDFFSEVELEMPIDLIISHSYDGNTRIEYKTLCQNFARNTSKYLLLKLPHFSNNEPNHSCDDNQIIRSLIELGFKVNEPMSQMVRFDLDEEFGNLYFFEK